MSDPVARVNTALEGRYGIERELGEGGMATVYLADDLKHQRKVALKVLKPELAAVVGAERFLAEIKTTANLTHPHILPLFDSGEADGFVFYVMPYVEGESLREKLDHRVLPFIIGLLLLPMGCGDSTGPKLASVDVSPATTTLAVIGGTVQFTPLCQRT